MTSPVRPVTLKLGDCLDVMRHLPDSSVDSVITDPPYGLRDLHPRLITTALTAWLAGDRSHVPDGRGFMGNRWDEFVPPPAVWDEVYRVLKPGGHLLAFAGTRTQDLMGLSIRLAGFELRDSVLWLYGTGNPKAGSVGKLIDKHDATAMRLARARTFQAWLREHLTAVEVDRITGTAMGAHLTTHPTQPAVATPAQLDHLRPHLPEVPQLIEDLVADRAVTSLNYAAREVTGLRTTGRGTGRGTVPLMADGDPYLTASYTAEARQWDGWSTTLKPAHEPIVVARKPLAQTIEGNKAGTIAANVLAYGTGALNIDACRTSTDGDAGRWPANVVLDEHTAQLLDEQTGTLTSGKVMPHTTAGVNGRPSAYGADAADGFVTMETYGDSGGASRFFYCAKATAAERPIVDGIAHPTVKPLRLIRWLVTLVTPPGGTVLDPFAGSGPLGEAAVLDGFRAILVERHAPYHPLIRERIARAAATRAALPETGTL